MRVAESQKQQVRSLFDARVPQWAAMYASLEPRAWSAQDLISRRRFALEMIEGSVVYGSKVLDIGCGTGDMAAELMRREYEVWGLDISEAMIRHVRQRFGTDRFRVGDIERLEFPDNTFDAVVCLGVMEYLDRDEPALRELWRVLKPDGKAVISTPNALCFFHHTDRLIRGLMAVARPLYRLVKRWRGTSVRQVQKLDRVTHRRYYRRRWLRLLRSTNMEPEEWLCHSWGWYTLSPFFGMASLSRVSDRFARKTAINWFANTQIVQVRAVK